MAACVYPEGGSTTSAYNYEFGGEFHPQIQYRPVLDVMFGAQVTPTPSFTPDATMTWAPTPSITPTPSNTPTGTRAPTATRTPTPLPTATPGAGKWITRICTSPTFDSNLDGAVNADDSYVRLFNGDTAGEEMFGWRLAFATWPAGDICGTTDPNQTFVFPRYSYLYGQRPKTIYQSDLKNMVGKGEALALPVGGTAATIALCDASGEERDRIDYFPVTGACLDIPH